MSIGLSFPALGGIADPFLEALLLLVVIHREPVLDEIDAGTDKHFFKQRAGSQELFVFSRGAKAHDALHTGAVVPTAVEEHHFARRRQMSNVTLEIPLAAFPFGRRTQRDNPAYPWVEALSDAFYDASLAGGIAALEDHGDFRPRRRTHS